ncbi:hypothetical protein J437_LFUL014327 [Ladona fulva]|uniref:Uncharacterized protein n=1 Tax=Ladona fulva TaxID=123851 RepID=A0A8K0P3N8_LADFU|nr:hypothetical protein J437_LFUL014327 [Ladona fulva]
MVDGVGPEAPPGGGAAPGGKPPGIPPGMPPGIPPGMPPGMLPPAPWYNLVTIGLHNCSSSFCLCSNSSFSASWFASSHAITSLHLSRIAVLSASEILSFSFSSSTVCFMLKQ